MKSKELTISRRSFLTGAGAVAAGIGIARTPMTAFADGSTPLPDLPWSGFYQELDSNEVRKLAYCLNKEGGCGHGGGQAIIQSLAMTVGEPWSLLPSGLYKYAGGGAVGWGTLCGALNGILATMNILGVHGILGNALMEYYSTTELPTNELAGWTPDDCGGEALPVVATTVSYSPLCHVSVSKWADAAGVSVKDPLKGIRCGMLVGDIAAKAVKLINAWLIDGQAPPPWVPPEEYADCYSCHTDPAVLPSQAGKMDCLECHDVSPAHGIKPWKKKGKK